MTAVHSYVGFAIPAGFAVLVLTSIFTYLANRDPGAWYWNLLAALQVVVGAQLLVGAILFVGGARPSSNAPSWLHYVYGAGFPVLVLAIAHYQARRRAGAEVLIFGVAAFLCTFSTLRALQTGFGID